MAVAGVCHSDDHFTTGDMVPTPDFAAVMEAAGVPPVEYFPCSAVTKVQASSRRSAPACAPCSPVIELRSRSSQRAVPAGGVRRA